MAKQSTPKPAAKLAETETLNGSNTLPAVIEIAAGHSVQLGEVVMAAHQKSGLSVEVWNALSEEERDGLLNTMIADFKAEILVDALPADLKAGLTDAAAAVAQGVTAALQERSVEGQLMIAEQVLIVSAPGGPRRRAGHNFGPVAVELRFEDLGADPMAALEALRADPMLKIDGRFEERPAE
jgi:hypothetical protein